MALKVDAANVRPSASPWIARMKEAMDAKAPPATNAPNALANIIRQIRADRSKKPKLSVVELRKAMKLLQSVVKSVGSIEVKRDGGFIVSVPDQATVAVDTANPWDELFADSET